MPTLTLEANTGMIGIADIRDEVAGNVDYTVLIRGRNQIVITDVPKDEVSDLVADLKSQGLIKKLISRS